MTMSPKSMAPSHTRRIYSDPKSFSALMTRITKQLRIIHKVNPFTMLAGCGNSALPILGVLGLRLGVPVIACRKSDDKRHHDYHQANGYFVDGKYLMIDDVVSSGRTVSSIRNSIELTARQNFFTVPECAGIFLYAAHDGKEEYVIPNYDWAGDKRPAVPMYHLDYLEERGMPPYKKPVFKDLAAEVAAEAAKTLGQLLSEIEQPDQ